MHKTRYVVDGCKLYIPTESVYLRMVTLRGLRTVVFVSELNGLEICATDTETFVPGGNDQVTGIHYCRNIFGDQEDHTMITHKELYGIRSSRLVWHKRLADYLEDMGVFLCKVKHDIWMRGRNSLYEYITVYVDDLVISARNPHVATDILMKKHYFKLKGTGPIKHHLGYDFFRDKNGVLCFLQGNILTR